jgi:hypothetical protein
VQYRIRRGTHVSHFHPKCPRWPTEDFYEQDKPLWWGRLCEECANLAELEVNPRQKKKSGNGN